MVVADRLPDAAQPPSPEVEQEVPPARGAFPGGQFDPGEAAAARPVDANGDQHGPGADDTVFPDLFMAGVEDQVGILGFQRLAGEAFQFRVERGIELAERAGAERVAAELLADGLDLPGRDALHMHLHQGRHQRLLAALVTAEELGAETALPVLRHAQFEGAHAG